MHRNRSRSRLTAVAVAAVIAAVAAPVTTATRSLPAQAAPLLSVDATTVLGPADLSSAELYAG